MSTTATSAAELSNEEILRYSRHLILPDVGLEGQRKLKPRACCSSVRAGLARPRRSIWRPLALALSGSWTSTSWTPRTCSGRCCTARRPSASASSTRRAIASRTSIRTSKVDGARDGSHIAQRARDHRHVRHSRRRHRQLPDALSRERCVRAAGQAERVREHLRFEGQASVFATENGPCYRCLFPRTSASGTRAELRRGRRAGRAAGVHRDDPGDRSASSSSSASVSRSRDGCCSSTRSACAFARSNCARIRSAPRAARTRSLS